MTVWADLRQWLLGGASTDAVNGIHLSELVLKWLHAFGDLVAECVISAPRKARWAEMAAEQGSLVPTDRSAGGQREASCKQACGKGRKHPPAGRTASKRLCGVVSR